METNLEDWKEFRTSMRTFQKSINEYLTSLVNAEGSAGDNEFISEESSEDEEKSPKRVLDLTNECITKSSKVPKV
ncbi:hypothetical protein JTB14_023819 [Gonioctena quinquepunctata]|nr:hypothetical protein JTB14_023819 [Gonioctena quinquepunctata]